jgi:hypothetical protein
MWAYLDMVVKETTKNLGVHLIAVKPKVSQLADSICYGPWYISDMACPHMGAADDVL